ncbi:MAG TPA: ATP-binding protein [Steroidobacteraceae bacterium]|nr:ATP-binding protein [Steroidobacteraceae bacterium]
MSVGNGPHVYLALLAHELRNLLAPIRYAIASLEKPDKTSVQESYALGVMRRQSTQMSDLLEDLLDLSRFERGQVQLRKSNAELKLLLETAIEAARPLIDAKQHCLCVELPSEPVSVWADPTRLIQVFSNVLINAAKYTNSGGHIELRATYESQSIVVSVRDSGIGIAKEMLPRLFTLFAQGGRARGHSQEGLGIGLALVDGIVRLHGGTVEARSDGVGCGSEFLVRIPMGISPQAVPVARNGARVMDYAGLKVLVVDDSKEVADTCSMLVELSGHESQIAYTGRRALELAETFRPQVILTDIGLPDIDGYEVAHRIRSTDWGHAAVMVAITGWADEGRAGRSLEAGFSHHLTKPIDPRTIELLLESLAVRVQAPRRY